ncbi:MAG TPA: hypothetical protein VIF60_08950 [Burkholderiaceae bacterium]|jgi:hypothetical protein
MSSYPKILTHAVVVLLVLFQCGMAAADPPDRPTYAAQCAAEMGKIEKFNCMDGDLLDITVNGVSQTKIVPKCDKPVQLGLSPEDGQCVPFSRLQLINTGNPNVTTEAICRKYHLHGTDGAKNTIFDDIAVIQHNKTSGRTCFFQSQIEVDLDGTSVPSPSDNTSVANSYWLDTPAVSNIHCSSCHAADPFIWSTFIAQKADLSKWNPEGKYDSNFANLFGAPSKVFKPTGNTCIGCHRFGRGPAHDFACNELPQRYTGNLPNATHPHDFLMPLPITANSTAAASAWHASHDASVAQIEKCCADPDLAECNSKLANDELPPDNGPRYSVVFRPGSGEQWFVPAQTWSSMYTTSNNYFKQGLVVTAMSTANVNGQVLYSASFRAGSGAQWFVPAQPWSDMYTTSNNYFKKGLYASTISLVETASGPQYSVVFRPGSGAQWFVPAQPWSKMYQTINDYFKKGYTVTALSSAVVNGEIQYSAVFRPGSGIQWVVPAQSWSQMYQTANTYFKQGLYATVISVVETSSGPLYSAVFRPGKGAQWVVPSQHWSDMYTTSNNYFKDGLYVQSISLTP